MESAPYANPYSGATFFEFFAILLSRAWTFATGGVSLQNLATDEVQIIVLAAISASAALVGTFLILRKMTMLANSLSHTILIGIVIAYLLTQVSMDEHGGGLDLQAMLIASVVMGIITAFLTEFLTTTGRLQEDASTGIVFTSLFAIGIILVTVLTRSAHIGTEAVMGNVDALQLADCKLAGMILAANVFLISLFFKEYKITTFDPGLAASLGFSPIIFNYLLMVQASATTIGAFRAVGVLMVLALITGPSLTARMLTQDLKRLLCLAILLGGLASLAGVALSRHLLTAYDMALSTGGLVICMIALEFLLVLSVKGMRDIFSTQRG